MSIRQLRYHYSLFLHQVGWRRRMTAVSAVTEVGRETPFGRMARPGGKGPVSCFDRAAGIYSDFALKRVARRGGRKPTFLLGRLECNVNRLGSGSLSGGFRKDPRRCRAGGALGGPGNR